MAGLTVKSTKLSGPGGYTTSTPTLQGGAGTLKPMGGGTASKPRRKAVTPFSGKSGVGSADTRALLKNVPRTVVPTVPEGR